MTDDDPLLRPRPIDLPTTLPLDGPIDAEAADGAKIFAAPDDPADWPRWRERLADWRDGARERWPYDDAAYTRPSSQWASRCFSVALVWLWDERLFDHDTQRFDVDAFLDGDGRLRRIRRRRAVAGLPDHRHRRAQPVRLLPRRARTSPRSSQAFQDRGVKVFVDYNPWDTATGDAARPPEARRRAGRRSRRRRRVPRHDERRRCGAARGARRAGRAAGARGRVEGVARTDRRPPAELGAVVRRQRRSPGVLRARWFERRHMLHHTRRWNRDHSDELQSSWMNGAGMLVWDAVFGSWVGWNERDRATLRRDGAGAAGARRRPHARRVDAAGRRRARRRSTPACTRRASSSGRPRCGRSSTAATPDYTGPVLDVAGRSASAWFEVTGGVGPGVGRRADHRAGAQRRRRRSRSTVTFPPRSRRCSIRRPPTAGRRTRRSPCGSRNAVVASPASTSADPEPDAVVVEPRPVRRDDHLPAARDRDVRRRAVRRGVEAAAAAASTRTSPRRAPSRSVASRSARSR